MTRQTQQGWRAWAALFLLVACVLLFATPGAAVPNGASISNPASETAPNRTAGSRADAGGSITTMVLSSIQQNTRWKAYVGNVTGVLTLDDATNLTIYDWDLTTIQGEVYASRYGNITWNPVVCANVTIRNAEATHFGMTESADDINSTFNWSIHKAFTVGSSPAIGANTCNSTVTYMNDTRQVPTTTSPYQEILTQDPNGYLVYLADISDNSQGFDNLTYDFQMIVPEFTNGTSSTYYFYVELSS